MNKLKTETQSALVLQADSDGIWLVEVVSEQETFQLGHVPWQTIAIYIKEYLD